MAERSLITRIRGRLDRDTKKFRGKWFRDAYPKLSQSWFAPPGKPKPKRPPAAVIDDVHQFIAATNVSGVDIRELEPGLEQPRVTPFMLGVENHHLFTDAPVTYRPRWTMRLPEGRIFKSSTVVSQDNYLIAPACFEFNIEQTRDRTIFHRYTLPSPKKLDRPIVSVCTDYSANYFHFMLETVPRIALFKASGYCEGNTLYRLNKPSTKFQRDILQILGVSEKDFIDPEDSLYVTAPIVYATSVDRDEHIHPGMIQTLRDLVLKDPPAKTSRRIYIERGQVAGRNIVNEAEVMELLKKNGFEIVRMDGLTIWDQAKLFSEAEAVCALHGAALTNLAYATEGGALIELLPPNYISRYYWDIATHRNMTYCAIIGEPEPGVVVDERDNFANTLIPLSLLTKALAHLGISGGG